MEELRTTYERVEPSTPKATDTGRDPGEMELYVRAMNRHPLLDRAGERALATEIEERSRALWATLLSHRATVAMIAGLAGERLPSAVALLEGVARAAEVAAVRPGARPRQALARAIRKASEQLHALDVDHLVADEVVARIAAAPPSSELREGAEAVADAARAVADARDRFVQANIGLVFHVAARYRSTSLSFGDFVQEGMFGLIKAVDRFDHRRGHRFSTYATWWIRHSMGRALADKSRLVRVPVHLLEARQRLATVHKVLRAELAREPSRDEIARAAGMSREKVARIQEASVVSEIRLDALIGEDEDRSRGDIFVDPNDDRVDADDSLHRRSLAIAAQEHMQALSPIEREVLRRRFALDGVDREETFREIALDHGLSRERIRQIQENALRKLRSRLARLDDDGDDDDPSPWPRESTMAA